MIRLFSNAPNPHPQKKKKYAVHSILLSLFPTPQAYIMGDLHGNFQDLITFGHSFWKQGANVCPASLVFLGDFVDRRFFGVEVYHPLCRMRERKDEYRM